jgi:hypothetical protein
LRQASGSSCIVGAFFEGGNGHNRQGFPGQRHPEHSASAEASAEAVAVAPASAAGIRQAAILNTLIGLKFIIVFCTWLAYHRLIHEFPRLQGSLLSWRNRINGVNFEEDMLQQLRYILRRAAQHRPIASYHDRTLDQIGVLHHDFHQFLIG